MQQFTYSTLRFARAAFEAIGILGPEQIQEYSDQRRTAFTIAVSVMLDISDPNFNRTECDYIAAYKILRDQLETYRLTSQN